MSKKNLEIRKLLSIQKLSTYIVHVYLRLTVNPAQPLPVASAIVSAVVVADC